MRWYQFLVLVRPANIVTAITDVVAGLAIAGTMTLENADTQWPVKLWLIFSTCCLYAGGIVFNDLFDLDLDRRERPNRPLPSGLISPFEASIFGSILLLSGIALAMLASKGSALIALVIAICALVYDRFGKHHKILGPINMGICRGLNLILGMSIVTLGSLGNLYWLGLLPLIFIAAVTLTSQGEVSGNNRGSIIIGLTLDILLAVILLTLSWKKIVDFWVIFPFVLLWLGMNLNAKIRAIVKNESLQIMNAVKIGVISLIPLNAIYVAGFGDWILAIAVLLLLPLAILLARKFAVT